jgi:hypothetical protein
MNSRFTLLFSFILLFSSSHIFAQDDPKGGIFEADKYDPETLLQYEEIDPSDVKSIKLSYREISKSTPNQYLFYPTEQSGNKMSLDSLMMWAVREDLLLVYDNLFIDDYDLEYFTQTADTISWERILKRREDYVGFDEIDMGITSPPELSMYIILESTIIGNNDKVLAVRPLLISPVQTFVRLETDTIKVLLYTAYFPDLLNLLQHHSPIEKIKNVKTTLDFFLKNKYQGKDYTNMILQYDVFGGDLIDQDTIGATEIQEGVFVDPGIGAFRGNPGLDMKEEIVAPLETPDLEGLSHAKYYKHTIDLRDKENWPLYLPVRNAMGLKNIQGVLMDGLMDGSYNAFDFDDERILTLDEIEVRMVEVESMFTMDEFGEEVELAYVESLSVEKLTLNELVFFDKNDKILHREPVELIALTAHWDYMPEPRYAAAFQIPFRDEGFRKHMNNSLVFNYEDEEYESFLSFLLQRKYQAELTRIQAISLKFATEKIGSSYWDEEMDKSKHSSIGKIKGNDPRIVIREVMLNNNEPNMEGEGADYYEMLDNILYGNDGSFSGKDIELPANYQLFFPQYEYNGFIPMFDLIKHGVNNESLKAYKYVRGGGLEIELKRQEFSELMIYRDSIYNYEFDSFEEIEEEIFASSIQKFRIIELHDGKTIIPVAIAPDISSARFIFDMVPYEGYSYLFWIPFTELFRDLMKGQEILRVQNEAVFDYYDLIFNRVYTGEIIEERSIEQEELEELIDLLNL